jgi:transglutaminase-like putative cysteine protease
MPDNLQIKEGWTTLFLLWGMIFLTAVVIFQADLVAGLEVLAVVGTIGLLTGLVIAKSKFSDGAAHLLSLLYGLFVIGYMTGRLLDEWLTWNERVVDIIARQAAWFNAAVSGNTSRDGFIFVMQTAVIFWLLGYTAGWFTFRKLRVWRAVVPTGIVLFSVVYYGPPGLETHMAFFILLALLFITATHFIEREEGWREAVIRYETTMRFSFLQAGLIAGLAILFAAWMMPTLPANAAVNEVLTVTGVNSQWRSFQNNWSRLFSALRAYGNPASDGYRDALLLGGPRNVSNNLVMDVYVVEQLPYAYWHETVLDTYRGDFWSRGQTPQRIVRHPDDGPFNQINESSLESALQVVVNYRPNASIMYGMPAIVAADQDALVSYQYDPDGRAMVIGVQSRYLLRPGDVYRLESRYSVADAANLRRASTEYPDWMVERYLQLPDSISAETIALANRLATPYDNAYDKAVAVRDYLRQNIAYNDQVDAPPPGVEPVHYFLFDSQEGYCNYYASAMTVMLRSQGVPARLAAGFASGEYNEDLGFYRVRDADAHVWVEVYFPDYGWIQFEPTASLPTFERPDSGDGRTGLPQPDFVPLERDLESMLPDEDIRALLGEDPLENPDRDLAGGLTINGDDPGGEGDAAVISWTERLFTWQAGAALLIFMATLLLAAVAQRLNLAVESNVDRSYSRLSQWAAWLGLPVKPAHTPYEQATMLATAVPEGEDAINQLTGEYVIRQFSRLRSGRADFNSLAEWRLLRPLLLRHTARATLRRWRK